MTATAFARTETSDRRLQSLVDVEWAREHLSDPKVRFFEVDVDTSAYDKGHLPGAVGINWSTQLYDPVVRELASRESLEELLRAAGVNDDTQIVLYGDNENWFAAWAYWQLKYQGFDNVRLVNGGRKKVESAELPLTTDATTHERGNVTLGQTKRENLRVYRDQVLASIGNPGSALVDVRSPAEYSVQLPS
jgi:thiosulfate/3-mercaptopyruvate sulfurtransferase